MAKPLLVAVLTFVALGVYYRQAEPEAPATLPGVAVAVADPGRAARSAALVGINVAKQELMESWGSGLFAGKHLGAKYNVSTTVRDDRARIKSVGRSVGAGGKVKTYTLGVEVYRSPRESIESESATDFSYRFRPMSTS